MSLRAAQYFRFAYGGGECETLFALLDAALYDDTADEKETKS